MTEFISRSYGQDEFEVIIKTDNKEHYKKAEDFSRKLIDHAKPQTNADIIRAMSDEEMADVIMCPMEISCISDLCEKNLSYTCVECSLQWLREPAEEER